MTINFIEGPHVSTREGKACLPREVTVAHTDTHSLAAKAKKTIDKKKKDKYYYNKIIGKEHSTGVGIENSESKKPTKK